MTGRRSLHARAALVVTVAAAVVVGTTTFATAHHDDDDTSVLHACVAQADGQLRLLPHATSSCRASETSVRWSTGTDGGRLDAFTAALKTADTDGGANDGDGLVHWTNLESVPESVTTAGARIDSLAVSGGGQLLHWSNLFAVPEILADGIIEFRDLTGRVTGEQLAVDSVFGGPGGAVADGSITADDLAGSYGMAGGDVVAGAVTGEKIFDETVEARDLAAGSVTSDKLALSSASYGDSAPTLLPAASAQDLPAVVSTVTVDGNRRVAVAAHAQVACGCTDPNAPDTAVSYQLVRVSDLGSTPWTYTAVSPVYTVDLSADHQQFPVSLSVLDTAGPGDHAYQLRLLQSGGLPGDVVFASPLISAQVLGAP